MTTVIILLVILGGGAIMVYRAGKTAQAISVLKDALEKRKDISSMNREQDRETDEILDALDSNGNGDSVRSPVDRDR